jgi:predicted house-cleaning noncanonical NTP pyrophosphatase (MazG superfamily)
MTDSLNAGASSLGAIRYNKLVRDRIPEIVAASGLVAITRPLSDEEYLAALRAKVSEEAAELADAPDDEVATEIADLQEVVSALMAALGLAPEEVERVRAERKRDRGAFETRTFLVETRPPEKK